MRRESGKSRSKLTDEQRQQIREDFTADEKGGAARFAELAKSVGGHAASGSCCGQQRPQR